MASLSRLELVNKFRKQLSDWNSMAEYRSEKAMDTTHIQMASVDEMMAAYGYVPRRLSNFPDIVDGRFGYQLAVHSETFSRPQFISLEDAVSLHNGNGYKGNPFRRMNDRMSFALSNRIVEQVGIQRDKWLEGGIKSTKRWVKFQSSMEVEDFSDLSNLPMEKLLKLRDVARDHHEEMQEAETQAWFRYQDILKAIEERKNA